MRTRETRSGSELLSSPKTKNASIPVRSPLFRDAAIQSLLDPHVRSVEFARSLRFRGLDVPTGLLMVERDGLRTAIEVADGRPPRTLEELGLVLLALDEAGVVLREVGRHEIEREPLFENCRRVWGFHDHEYTEADCSAIGAAFDDGAATFGDLRRRTGLADATLYAMTCADLLGIDLSRALHDASVVIRIGHFAVRRPIARRAAR